MLFEHMCDSLWLLPETWALNNMYEACVLGGRCITAQSVTFAHLRNAHSSPAWPPVAGSPGSWLRYALATSH